MENNKIILTPHINQDKRRENNKVIKMSNTVKYESRDLSWLKFNDRILQLAKDKTIPLGERMNFLSITASNLDEFTMVRLANLIKEKEDKKKSMKTNIMGDTYKTEYKKLQERIDIFLDDQANICNDLILELNTHNVSIITNRDECTEEDSIFINKYFEKNVLSLLTPMVFDNTKPYPLIQNNVLYIGIILKKENGQLVFGTIQVPQYLDRVIKIKSNEKTKYILIEDLIIMNLDKIFIGKEIFKTCVYRVLRDFYYSVADEKKVFIADQVTESIKRRKVNNVIRLDIYGNKKAFTEILCKALKINKNRVNKSDAKIDLTFFSKIKIKGKEFKYDTFKPHISEDIKGNNIFKQLDQEDILIHHPYESYDTVVDFIKQAAKDPNVTNIKQTLYRVTENSPILKALIKAADNGKSVTVLLEVKARFDEENNIKWANKLESHGVYVVYGMPGVKTHCKMCLVVKKNKNNLIKYCHIGTGNYNEKNSKLYTDLSYFTSKPEITKGIEKLFNYLTGFSNNVSNDYIWHSPYQLQNKLIECINKEIKYSNEGKEASIVLKVNALTDKDIIDKIYEARDAGVKIILIVRSACSLIDTKGIIIKSMVGRFLEHSRIYYFKNSGYYIGSSDLMERNLKHRVELMVRIEGNTENKLKKILDTYINDESCFKMEYGEYVRLNNENGCQDNFIKEVIEDEKIIHKNSVENIDTLNLRDKEIRNLG